MSDIEKNISASSILHPVLYGKDKISKAVNILVGDLCKMIKKLNDEPDQFQSLIDPIYLGNLKLDLKKSFVVSSLYFIKKIEEYSAFFKHEFWEEEKEVRAAFQINFSNISGDDIKKLNNSYYYDLPITIDCIDHIILGPEFDKDEFEYINKHSDYLLDFNKITHRKSIGTGVIRNS